MSLKAKLLIFCLVIGLAPLAGMGAYSTHTAAKSLRRQAFQELSAIREAKSFALEQQMEEWLRLTRSIADLAGQAQKLHSLIADMRG